MLITISNIVVLAAGIAVCAMSVWGFYAPQKLVLWAKGAMAAGWGFWFAIIIRLLLGMALLIAAPTSQFPSAFSVIGWIAIAAAVVVAVMGRTGLREFADWILERLSSTFIRIWVLFGLAFGGFLVYGVT